MSQLRVSLAPGDTKANLIKVLQALDVRPEEKELTGAHAERRALIEAMNLHWRGIDSHVNQKMDEPPVVDGEGNVTNPATMGAWYADLIGDIKFDIGTALKLKDKSQAVKSNRTYRPSAKTKERWTGVKDKALPSVAIAGVTVFIHEEIAAPAHGWA